MIFKVYYQETKTQNPKREETQSMYVDAPDLATVRVQAESQTAHHIEHIEQLSEKALAYEQQSADFKLTEF
ncbi:DNA-directed RNA polymerase subunit epsilon [Weissella ceti]|uniref:DNA-directed RNA polymerase subunit epsilon n=1 Tax=Weissella ceti TaxID=759620 RepID=A0ABT3E367_9LACO|nr:DNA-directed RNA polymerase subunit epsilon [Weissella ceti]MCW0952866.1 DNA-directed RNA polymerase subunit epsilon [Weissella ceti]QVK12561.1 DNA-dependent RNA polymerase auxiliary subunit epsilon family protein [Weissella ceti]